MTNLRSIEELAASIIENSTDANEDLRKDIADLLKKMAEAKKVTVPQQGPGKYVYCVELTRCADGVKEYHPIVGRGYPSDNIDDYVMLSSTDIVDLQEENKLIAKSIEYMGYDVTILFMTNEIYSQLEEMLSTLVTKVFSLVDHAMDPLDEAKSLLSRTSDADELTRQSSCMKSYILSKLFEETRISGQGITRDFEICDSKDVTYEEDYPDDEYDEYDEDEDEDDEDYEDIDPEDLF